MSYVDIVFDGPPGPEPGHFVEVENSEGASIRFGEWVQRSDGYWVLRLHGYNLNGEMTASDAATEPNPRACCVCGFGEKEHDATTHQYVPKGPSTSDAGATPCS
jgi:hypothetical protein